MSYIYYDDTIEDVWSYAKYFQLIDSCLLDFVSQNYFWDRLKRIKPIGEVYVSDDYRIDLIVWQAFRSKEYWWVVLLYNGVMPEQVVSGMSLLLPDLREVEYLLAEVKLKKRLME